MEGFGTDTFSFETPTCSIEGLETNSSGPEVATYEIEAIMMAAAAESPTEVNEPIFLDFEPMRAGRKRKAKDMSELTLCFCGERVKPGDVGSIQCQKAGCATVWVSYSATFMIMADTACSIIFNVLDMRTHD